MPRLIVLRSAAILLATATVAAGQPSAVRNLQRPATTSARTTPRPTTARTLPGARTSGFTTIEGNALDSANGQLPNAIVRLRDARFGQIVGTELTDNSGLFAFRAVDPGSYIVEMMGNDWSVLAASEILNVNAGEVALAIVKLPLTTSTFAGVLGANSTPAAAALVTQAAASGVVAVIATDPVSPIE
jgi:hypothetical protein